MPPPTPPMVNEGRMMAGNPVRSTTVSASSSVLATPLSGTAMPISFMASRNNKRSSATLMAGIDAPISATWYFLRMPSSSSCTARLSAVCPPTVGRMASGFSIAMIFSSTSGVSGSTYVRSANSGSVMIVAGLLLTRMTSRPSARSALHACVPE